MASLPTIEQLKDIHLPELIKWWPLAIGGYMLLILMIFILLAASYFCYRRYKYSRPKQYALKKLAFYEQQYLQLGNSQMTSVNVVDLLRRVALVYFPRQQVAGLQQQEWLDFLNNTSKNTNFNECRASLLEVPYQACDNHTDLKPLIQNARAWIKQRGVPCSN